MTSQEAMTTFYIRTKMFEYKVIIISEHDVILKAATYWR